jgi:hypothetical protein
MRVHLLLGAVLAVGCLLPAVGQAEDQRVISCAWGKSYCTEEMRPVLSGPDAARAEAGTQVIGYDPDDETRKKQARIASGYRDPSVMPLCAPPRRMTQRDGCQ